MIFSEIYGEYFNAVAKILDTAVRDELDENDIINIVGKVHSVKVYLVFRKK